MRLQVSHRAPPLRPPISLVVPGGLVRTFGGLAIFLVISFLCSGIYLLEKVFANPIAAQAAALIFGAFVIALGTILLLYFLKPVNAPSRTRQKNPRREMALPKPQFIQELSLSTGNENAREDLIYQRVYVDHSRIRP